MVIEQHPEITQPVTLEALPAELAPLDKAAITAVVLTVQLPGEEESMRRVIPVDKFDKLAAHRPMTEVLAEAAPAPAQSRQTGSRRSHHARADGGPLIKYSDPENAGYDHQGVIAKKEAEFVRANLALTIFKG